MEPAFQVSTRLRDALRGTALETNERLQRLEEIELIEEDPEALMALARGLVYQDFANLIAGKVVWFSLTSFIADGDTQYEFRHTDFERLLDFTPLVCLTVGNEDVGEILHRVYIWSHITSNEYKELGAERSLVIEDATSTLIQLLSELQVNALMIQWCPRQQDWLPQPTLPVSETVITHLLRHGHNLHLTFQNFEIQSEPVARQLGAANSITSLHLRNTGINSSSLASFCEGLASNLGPERLSITSPPTHLPFFEVFSALSRNTRLSQLSLARDGGGVCDANAMLQLEACIRENRGLKQLELRDYPIRGDAWVTFWRALGSHSSLERIDFHGTDWPTSFVAMESLIEIRKQLKIRTRAVAKAIVGNANLKHLGLLRSERDEDIWSRQVVPRINYNLHIDRFEKIKAGGDSVRRAVLLRSLFKVYDNPALLHLCLSKNMDLIDEFTTHDAEVMPVVATNESATSVHPVILVGGASIPVEPTLDESDPSASRMEAVVGSSISRYALVTPLAQRNPSNNEDLTPERHIVLRRRLKYGTHFVLFAVRIGNALLRYRPD